MIELAEKQENVIVDEHNQPRFRVETLEERLQGVKIKMYFTVHAGNEPWIKGEVYEKVITILVENNVTIHRQAPNSEPPYE